jgi:hypothetical protein
MQTPKTVILSAPSGWGKTRLEQVLRKGFGCQRVVDEWAPDMPITAGALHLTNCDLNKLPPSTEAVTVLRFP